MSEFVLAYIQAALFSSTDETDTPLDKRFGIEDIAPECLAQMKKDCEDFQSQPKISSHAMKSVLDMISGSHGTVMVLDFGTVLGPSMVQC